MDTQKHLAQANKVYEDESVRVEFKPIFCHPFNGWQIVSVEHKS